MEVEKFRNKLADLFTESERVSSLASAVYMAIYETESDHETYRLALDTTAETSRKVTNAIFELLELAELELIKNEVRKQC